MKTSPATVPSIEAEAARAGRLFKDLEEHQARGRRILAAVEVEIAKREKALETLRYARSLIVERLGPQRPTSPTVDGAARAGAVGRDDQRGNRSSMTTPARGDKRELVRKLASAGKDLDTIAAALGLSRINVRAHVNALKRQGKLPSDLPGLGLAKVVTIKDAPEPPPRKPTRQPDRPREDQVLELAREGKKAKTIAEELDISVQPGARQGRAAEVKPPTPQHETRTP